MVLCVLGGLVWVIYERGWVSDYMAASLLSDLARNGPSSVVDLNGPGDKWQLIHVNGTLRRKCAEPQYIERLMEGIAPTEHIVEVQRMCLIILSELAHDRQNNTTTLVGHVSGRAHPICLLTSVGSASSLCVCVCVLTCLLSRHL